MHAKVARPFSIYKNLPARHNNTPIIKWLPQNICLLVNLATNFVLAAAPDDKANAKADPIYFAVSVYTSGFESAYLKIRAKYMRIVVTPLITLKKASARHNQVASLYDLSIKHSAPPGCPGEPNTHLGRYFANSFAPSALSFASANASNFFFSASASFLSASAFAFSLSASASALSAPPSN